MPPQTDYHVGFSREFLSIVAHDLRAPIHLIKINAELLKREVKDKKSSDKIESRANNIRRISESMGRLVELLLDACECNGNELTRLPIKKSKTQILPTLRYVVENYSLFSCKNGTSINLYVVGDVSCLVDCDLHKIEQVFWNLLDNAIKYAPQGSEIAVVLEKTKAGMRVSVSNRGCFLDRSTCDLIFDKNFVFDARTSGARGLGLFISKLIIESHDGKIWADVDGGSFKISFDIPC